MKNLLEEGPAKSQQQICMWNLLEYLNKFVVFLDESLGKSKAWRPGELELVWKPFGTVGLNEDQLIFLLPDVFVSWLHLDKPDWWSAKSWDKHTKHTHEFPPHHFFNTVKTVNWEWIWSTLPTGIEEQSLPYGGDLLESFGRMLPGCLGPEWSSPDRVASLSLTPRSSFLSVCKNWDPPTN